ncbi:MAG: hypothetical protein ICV67_07690 [Thermoleophilia bacterium]|nr:hypothetical protein [Thermoleophilia bacterium]
MRQTRNAAQRTCAICERSLLMGERAVRFAPYHGAELVDVCPLCVEQAVAAGWIKEGSPTTPTVPVERRRRRGGLARLFDLGGRAASPPVVSEPILRRLSEREQAMVEAAELFNASDYRRTVAGIARSLGEPRVSVVPLSGAFGELVITVAWDISWYQYRVSPDSSQPVRLAGRGQDTGEIETPYTAWNAQLHEDGRVTPDIERV